MPLGEAGLLARHDTFDHTRDLANLLLVGRAGVADEVREHRGEASLTEPVDEPSDGQLAPLRCLLVAAGLQDHALAFPTADGELREVPAGGEAQRAHVLVGVPSPFAALRCCALT